MRARVPKPRAGRLRALMLRGLRSRLLREAERRLDAAATADEQKLTLASSRRD